MSTRLLQLHNPFIHYCFFPLVLEHRPLLLSTALHFQFTGNRSFNQTNFIWISPFVFMSHRPNIQGGRRGGGGRGGGRGGGGRGGGRGGGGEQRWWDPVWRAERLRQKAAEMEKMDENEWRGKIEQMKRGGEQEMVIRRNFSRDDQEILADMAYQLGLYL